MKIYLIAGETSGDIHGAELVSAIKRNTPNAIIRAMGGSQMKKAGAEISYEYDQFAFMGFVEVIKNIRIIQNHFKNIESDIRYFNPDKIIFIDYPGFNLRLAKKLYKDYSLHYYIAPKAWAWKEKRSIKLATYMDTVNCILPFEIDFFKKYQVNASYVGNPSKNQVARYIGEHDIVTQNYIALFPGSRKQEIQKILPVMLEAIRKFPNISYKISQAPGMDKSIYQDFLHSNEDLVEDNYALLSCAKAALVTSGTATLETALFNIPQVVLYIANPISYAIGKHLVKVKYISLVNLILDKPVVTELIQSDCNVQRITQELESILYKEAREKMQQSYTELHQVLGKHNAAENAIQNILK